MAEDLLCQYKKGDSVSAWLNDQIYFPQKAKMHLCILKLF